MDELKHAVFCQLQKGKDCAVSGKLLALRLKERDTRRIRLAIIELLKDGIPIIGDAAHGYYIADNIDDCIKSLVRLRKTGKMLFLHYKHLKNASRKLTGQLSLKF